MTATPATPEVPLIYTTLGNIPVSTLEHYVRWENNDDYVKFVEIYMHQGVVVKESAHVMAKKAPAMAAEQAAMA